MKAINTALDCKDACPDAGTLRCIHCDYEAAFEEGCKIQALATWSIAYKEGQDYEHKIMLELAVDEGNKAFKDGKKEGIKEVVEHVQDCAFRTPAFYSHIQVEKNYWQAKIKEWGLNG